MMKQCLIALLCAATACAGDDDDIGDTETELILSQQSVHTFSATSGNGVVIRITDPFHTSFVPAFVVRDPSGNAVASTQGAIVASASFHAPATGTYTLTVHDAAQNPSPDAIYGRYIVIAPGGHQGSALVPGGVHAGNIDEGELDPYTFTATVGEGIALRVADLAGGALTPGLTIYGPAGNAVTWTAGVNVAGESFAAPSTGTYTVVIYDASSGMAATGAYNLYYTKAPGANQGGLLSPGGSVLQQIDKGELDSYTFTATVGEGIALRVADLAGGALTPGFTIYGPAGNAVTWTAGVNVAGESLAAPSTGTYTVVVYDASSGMASTGAYKLYYTKAPGANQGGLLSPGGSVLGTIDRGELDSYTFTATVGEGIVLRVADLAGGALTPGFTVYGPAGNAVTWTAGVNVAGDAFAAPSTGTYTLVVYDASSGMASTGDYKLYYVKAPGANEGGLLSPGGSVLEQIDKGDLDSYTFTAAAGEGIVLRVADLAGGALTPGFTVYDPTGNAVTWTAGVNVASDTFAAPLSGTYTLVVYDASSGMASNGAYKLYYVKAPGANEGGLLSPGNSVFEQIDRGDLDSHTFTAVAGQVITLQVTDLAAGTLTPGFSVYGPAGNFLTSAAGLTVASKTFTASATGTFTLVVYDASSGLASTGNYRLDYTRTP
jgi:hypothetical protein